MDDKLPLARLDHSKLPSTAKASLPETYKAACAALATCSQVDECKEWSDKAAALASYAKQAQNDELYKTAVRIQARAIRRCGELLKEWPVVQTPGSRSSAATTTPRAEVIRPAPAARPQPSATPPLPQRSRTEVAEAAGLSRDQRIRAVAVAEVPAERFEEMAESEEPPTVTELASGAWRDRFEEPAPRPAPIQDTLHGRDPVEFRLGTKLYGAIEDLVAELTGMDFEAAWRGSLDHERPVIASNARKALDLCERLNRCIEGASKCE